MNKAAVTVIVADDHPLFGVALRLSVKRAAPDADIIEVQSFEALKAAVQERPDADLLLLDLMMPDVEGLSALQFLHDTVPQLRVAVVSAVRPRSWARATEALGAIAFVPKSTAPEQTVAIIASLLDGGSWWPENDALAPAEEEEPVVESRLARLSRQELRILLQIRDGRLNKQIADDLGITESTVKTHISTLLRKLDLQSRTQAAVLAQRLLTTSA